MQAKRMIFIAIFAALTAVGAFIRIPFGFNSLTLQVFFTIMAGVLLGAKDGALSQIVYVLVGLVGFPVFTLGGGFTYVLQPSFGFLVGLIPMAYVIGMICGHKPGGVKIAAASLLGLAILYLIGLPYMYLLANLYLGKALSASYVIIYGMLVYLPGDFIKIAVAAVICPKIARRIRYNETA